MSNNSICLSSFSNCFLPFFQNCLNSNTKDTNILQLFRCLSTIEWSLVCFIFRRKSSTHFAGLGCCFLISLGANLIVQDSPCDPCMVHCCLHWCALCQEHREIKGRPIDNTTTLATIVDPPLVQEMDAIQDKKSSSSSSEEIADHNNLQIQPLEKLYIYFV